MPLPNRWRHPSYCRPVALRPHIAAEFQLMTGHDRFEPEEIERTIDSIGALIFED